MLSYSKRSIIYSDWKHSHAISGAENEKSHIRKSHNGPNGSALKSGRCVSFESNCAHPHGCMGFSVVLFFEPLISLLKSGLSSSSKTPKEDSLFWPISLVQTISYHKEHPLYKKGRKL